MAAHDATRPPSVQQTIFFTGFPGFLGTALLPRVLGREDQRVTATCLVQAKFRDLADARVATLTEQHSDLSGRIHLVEGDITAPRLGLRNDVYAGLAAATTEVFHLAAVYDLSVPEQLAVRVNVDGTRHLCDFAEAAGARHHYVSTCYVSGRVTGAFTEHDLVVDGQRFNNHYESTKHAAEVIVRTRMTAGHPTTIYRPAVVSGDSVTGATQKFDGLYFVIRLLLRQSGPVAIMPTIGATDAFTFNVVPRDVVVAAIAELSAREDTVNRCFALADPRPLTIRQLIDTIGAVSGKRIIRARLPAGLARATISNVPAVSRLLQMPPDAIDYFTHPTHYTASNTWAALAGTGIALPGKRRWLGALSEFYRANPHTTSDAMV